MKYKYDNFDNLKLLTYPRWSLPGEGIAVKQNWRPSSKIYFEHNWMLLHNGECSGWANSGKFTEKRVELEGKV